MAGRQWWSKRWSKWLGVAALGLWLFSCRPAPGQETISGIVKDENGPLAGAVVRVKATVLSASTDEAGRFTLTGLDEGQVVKITAWKAGYYIGGGEEIEAGRQDVEIVLHAHHATDNTEYAWLPSTFHSGQGESQGCSECHSRLGADLTFDLPVDEWKQDAHSGSAANPRFLSMYMGGDLDGNQSPATRFGFNRDYGRFPLRPDPNQPYYGPGYKLDFPETAGNCAACHTPAAAINDAYGTDPAKVTGVESEGVPCDFCHKVWGVRLDEKTKLPYLNMPGVLSFEFRRPPDGHQFFAGPLDDVAPGEDTFSPVQRLGQFCAPCHFGSFWDIQIYNSYGEWLASPYSQADTGKTCQDCHMPSSGAQSFARPDKGGESRDPATIFSHRMPGAGDQTLLQNALTMQVEARRDGADIAVQVSLINDLTGHHIPTDSPLRHLILLVQAFDETNQPLSLEEGSTLPEWCGVGDPASGYYAGLPGVAYAKILSELWTEITPTGAYWNPTRIVSDNRLAAFSRDESLYRFKAPGSGEARIQVRLFFRRAFIELMDQKGWKVADILMEQVDLRVP